MAAMAAWPFAEKNPSQGVGRVVEMVDVGGMFIWNRPYGTTPSFDFGTNVFSRPNVADMAREVTVMGKMVLI
jgi:hypothetical protein